MFRQERIMRCHTQADQQESPNAHPLCVFPRVKPPPLAHLTVPRSQEQRTFVRMAPADYNLFHWSILSAGFTTGLP
jgi:hypothetical protein